MTGLKPPCGKVCPERTATCRLACEKWKVYEEAKRAEYARREAEFWGSGMGWSDAHEKLVRKGIMHKSRRPGAYGNGKG